MRKQILKAFLLLCIVASASTAMAAQTISGTVTIGAGNTFSPSTKVVLRFGSIADFLHCSFCPLERYEGVWYLWWVQSRWFICRPVKNLHPRLYHDCRLYCRYYGRTDGFSNAAADIRLELIFLGCYRRANEG